MGRFFKRKHDTSRSDASNSVNSIASNVNDASNANNVDIADYVDTQRKPSAVSYDYFYDKKRTSKYSTDESLEHGFFIKHEPVLWKYMLLIFVPALLVCILASILSYDLIMVFSLIIGIVGGFAILTRIMDNGVQHVEIIYLEEDSFVQVFIQNRQSDYDNVKELVHKVVDNVNRDFSSANEKSRDVAMTFLSQTLALNFDEKLVNSDKVAKFCDIADSYCDDSLDLLKETLERNRAKIKEREDLEKYGNN